jgi:rare lipoprotein A
MSIKLNSGAPAPLAEIVGAEIAGAEPTAAGMFTVLGILIVLLPACMSLHWDSSSSSQTTKTTNSGQKASRGNPPFYVVFGERYYVMPSSQGYRKKGVASWYGKKFHGKPTSSGEIYDMHEMTAAHKTLPLPTRVRVTNLTNGKSVIVKVNDRGPFVDNRIIDMSYSAAKQLDMIANGTALVEVEALGGSARVDPAETFAQSAQTAAIAATAAADSTVLFLQIGAFGEQVNAQQLQQQLESNGFSNVRIHHDIESDPALYRVRLGPIQGVAEYDALVAKMATFQINDTHLVTESSANTSELSGS